MTPEDYGKVPADRLLGEITKVLTDGLLRGEPINPAVLVYMPIGSTLLDMPWHSDALKQASIRALRRFMKMMDVRRYCFFAEGWVSQVSGDFDMSKPPAVMPRDDPNRQEVLFVIVADKGGEPIGNLLEIKRSPAGEVTSVEPMEGSNNIVGPMATMLATFQ